MSEQEETEINSSNFGSYFADVRHFLSKKGDVIARFRAVAELIDGFEKREMIELLKKPNSARAVSQMMRKLANAMEPDTYSVPIAMAKDILAGMSDDEIAKKPYEYTIELFYYAQPEYVPKDDLNWTIISIVNAKDYITSKEVTTDAIRGEEKD